MILALLIFWYSILAIYSQEKKKEGAGEDPQH
jgi:hypothetical protein